MARDTRSSDDRLVISEKDLSGGFCSCLEGTKSMLYENSLQYASHLFNKKLNLYAEITNHLVKPAQKTLLWLMPYLVPKLIYLWQVKEAAFRVLLHNKNISKPPI